MADVLPPKKQAVVERLRRRIESYRRHQSDCIPRFDQSFNGHCEQNIQDTLALKQRFLENKAKRAAKKTDKKQPENSLQNVHSLPKFAPKRSASDDLDRNDGFSDPPPPKTQAQSQPSENLTKFSVEIVQQLEFTTSSSNSQISTNVTVKALNTSVKSDMGGGGTCTTSTVSPRPLTPRTDIVECKKEQEENPEFVDLEQCAAALEKDAAVNGGSTFPGFSDLIGDDTSDAIITSDAFKDLISEISDFHPEFMKDFDFDGGDTKNIDTSHHHHHQQQPQQQQAPHHPQLQQTFKTEDSDPKTAPQHHQHMHQQQRVGVMPGAQRMYSSTGMDFSKAELSPAAQTLKQMAEQHQHKTQLGMNFNPAARTGGKPPYSDFQFGNSGGGSGGHSDYVGSPGSNGSAGNQTGGYKQQSILTPPSSNFVSSDNIKQEVFSAQNSPGVYSPGSTGKTTPVQSQQSRLGAAPSGFKQQYSPYSSPGAGAHGSPQYTPRPGPGQGQQGGPPPNQAPPRPPSCPGTTTLSINQAQQLHISQSQGQPIQVSMAQNLSTEMKPGAVSVAAQQGLYFSQSPLPPTQTVAGESYCTVSQSQTINFTQQTLRQRAPARPADKMMHPQMIRAQQPQQPPAPMGVRPPPPEYKPQPQPPNVPLLHAMMGQRGFSPTRRVVQQPMPPSSNISLRPMLRPQQQQQQQQHPGGYMNPGVNSMPTLHTRAQYPRPQKPPQPMGLSTDTIASNSPEWRHLLLAQQQHQQQQQQQHQHQHQHQQQQARPTFHQAQGIAFASGGLQMAAGQMQQQLSHMAQQQSLGVQHNNSQMSVSLHMQQTMGGRPVQNTNTVGQLPSTFTTPSSGAPASAAAYSTGYGNATTNFQHSMPYPQLPSDLNLDFLEHLPTSDTTHFSDQELLSSLESGASFNLQDIL